MDKEIEIEGKKYILKELKYKDIIGKHNEQDKSVIIKDMVKLSTGMSDDDFNNLSLKAGVKLTAEINKLNGLTDQDFMAPQTANI